MPPQLADPAFDFNLASVGLYVQYDGRNSSFAPSEGISAKLKYKNFDKLWGSDYDNYKASLIHFTSVGQYSSLGLRLVGQTVTGEVPFVTLRGNSYHA